MLTIPSIKADIETLLAGQLGTWTRDDGTTLPSIYAGRPPDGVTMTSAGVQCIILDTAQAVSLPYMGGTASRAQFTHMVDLEMFLPEDVEPPQLNTAGTLLALAGIEDAPVHRIMTAPAFLQFGVPMNPVNAPRFEMRKAHSIIYLNSYCLNE